MRRNAATQTSGVSAANGPVTGLGRRRVLVIIGALDARDVPRGARPDDRLDGAADDRRRPPRRLAPLLDRRRLSAGRDGLDAALGKARRPVRPEGLLPGGHRHLPGRLGLFGAQPQHDRAHRVPGGPGSRWRRADGRHPGDRRGRRLSPRARPLPGALRCGVRRREHHRAAARRRLRRAAVLALDLLHQRPDRRRRARRRGRPGSGTSAPGPPRHRLSRDGRPRSRHDAVSCSSQASVAPPTAWGSAPIIASWCRRCACSSGCSPWWSGTRPSRCCPSICFPSGPSRSRASSASSSASRCSARIIYLPVFFQIVHGDSPTISGLRLLPLWPAWSSFSTASGQIISRTGRYRVFPIVGTGLMTIGLLLLSRMGAGTSSLVTALYMLVLGVGLGCVMQVLVLIVQNAVPYAELGVATSGRHSSGPSGDRSAPRSSARSSPTCSSATWSDISHGARLPSGMSSSSVTPAILDKLPRRFIMASPPPMPSRSRRCSSSRHRSASSHSSRPGSYPAWSSDRGCKPPRSARQRAERMSQHRKPSRVRPSRSSQIPLTARADRPSPGTLNLASDEVNWSSHAEHGQP